MRRIFLRLKRQKKQAILFIVFLTLLNTVLDDLLVKSQSLPETIMAMVISFPIISFLLGLFPALIPIRKLSYLRRWLTYSYLWLFMFHCLFLASFTIIIIGKIVDISRGF